MSAEQEESSKVVSFQSFGLDPRLTRVLERQNIVKPTLIQEKAIPLALAGKDLLAKSRTGSGKTLAYLLPILQRLISHPKTGSRVLILVPTKELARQVSDTLTALAYYVSKEAVQVNLAGEESMQLQRSMLAGHPAILISTPARILPHLESQAINLHDSLDFLVVDEADLVLSFGYSSDLETLVSKHIPKTAQTFLMSATLNEDMEKLKKLALRNPVTLKLEEADSENDQLEQYIIRCAEDDKFLVMYVTLKLKLLKGKILIFTNDVDRCFRLKLFLEQFGIKTCVLNPELPAASRHHIVEEFNKGVYDIIIASDLQASSSATPSKQKKGKVDKEFGVARGVDFKRVDVVINFDLPQRPDSYVHRVGRTARAHDVGTAISFVTPSNHDERSFALISKELESRNQSFQTHAFDIKQIDGFRYRCDDAIRAVTKSSIKHARLRSIKNELAKSEKLRSFWEERPKDLALLRHDNHTNVIKTRPHMKHVPEYLMAGKVEQDSDGIHRSKIDPLPQNARTNSSEQPSKSRKRGNRRPKDPLRSFKV